MSFATGASSGRKPTSTRRPASRPLAQFSFTGPRFRCALVATTLSRNAQRGALDIVAAAESNVQKPGIIGEGRSACAPFLLPGHGNYQDDYDAPQQASHHLADGECFDGGDAGFCADRAFGRAA